ncbi:dihydrofolate reductase family protein [Streptomyces olivochromogenes]|uniref:dihydrofolate reductase family protein n=1 Tax=Streptomyces olivochromogenes TaxID=1963 RepID=UPI001F18B05E|nr:dihydrofolate reductase family protein [Streptomyces olivochromogenes]MCF3130191.1 dihydrofolate reductase [Streptomyces olivochromogenes]
MARITVTESVTLDGVMQGLGRPDEDNRDGFRHGGWGPAYMDAVMMEVMGRGMAATGAMLFGRRTYLDFFGAWADRTDGNPFTQKLNGAVKYVASRSLAEPLPWQNSTLLSGDAGETVAALKKELDEDLVVLGSGELVRSLAAAGLVDRYVLSIHPLVLGSGRRLFADSAPLARFRLVESVSTGTGVVIATYERSEAR